MHSGAGGGFNRLQIETAGPAQSRENNLKELIYFVRDFLLDRFGRFFSCGVRASWTGRKRQIFSLTSMKSRLIC